MTGLQRMKKERKAERSSKHACVVGLTLSCMRLADAILSGQTDGNELEEGGRPNSADRRVFLKGTFWRSLGLSM